MIIQSIFRKIQVHPIFYVAAFFAAITGYLKDFSIFMMFIITHECGHILSAFFYRWNISKIVLFPLGAVTFFDEKINRPLKEEFIIAISGILLQILFFEAFFHRKDMLAYKNAHIFLLYFNLLPIYPLDGAKIVNLMMNLFLPFIKSYTVTLGISYGMIFSFLFIFSGNLIFVLALFLLLLQVWKETKNGKFIFQKFLLERHLYHFPFSKSKQIKGYHLENMKRDYKHHFWIQKKCVKEEDILKSLFDKKR